MIIRSMRIVAVVLAAGAGRRIGGPKALLRIGPRSFLAHAAERLARPGVAEVVAVLGHEAERVRAEAGLPAGLVTVVNPAYAEGGMLGSVLAGLDAAEARGAEAVLLHPVDHPLIAAATVDAVVQALAAGARIAVPSRGRAARPPGRLRGGHVARAARSAGRRRRARGARRASGLDRARPGRRGLPAGHRHAGRLRALDRRRGMMSGLRRTVNH